MSWRRILLRTLLAARAVARAPIEADGRRMDRRMSEIVRLARPAASDWPGKSDAIAALRARVDTLPRITMLPPAPGVTMETFAIGASAARSYRPDGLASGTLLFLHGGGFILGSLVSHDPLCRLLARCSGRRVIAIGYRLAPEHPFPAALDDARAAFAWARQAEPGDLAVGGDSAGANLAAVLAQTEREQDISRQFLLYPALDMAGRYPSDTIFARGFLLTAAAMETCAELYAPAGIDRADPLLSPLRGDLRGVAPAIVVTAGFDPLRDQGGAYAAALQAGGVPATLIEESGLAHGFADFAGVVPAARRALERAAVLLRAA